MLLSLAFTAFTYFLQLSPPLSLATFSVWKSIRTKLYCKEEEELERSLTFSIVDYMVKVAFYQQSSAPSAAKKGETEFVVGSMPQKSSSGGSGGYLDIKVS